MKKLKWILIIIVIALIILAVILFAKLRKEQESKQWLANSIDEDMQIDIEEHVIPVRGMDEFVSIEKVMTNFYLYLQVGNAQGITGILTEEFKTKEKITEENAIKEVTSIAGSGNDFHAREIYFKDNLAKPVYFIYGIIASEQNQKESYATVHIDNQNGTFAVEPISKEKYENYRSEKIEVKLIEKIEKNNYNKYMKSTLGEDEIIQKYFTSFLKENLQDVKYAYTLIDDSYKQAKYPKLTDYQAYINSNRQQIETMIPEMMKTPEDFATEEEFTNYMVNYETKGIDQYKIDEREGYTQYTFLDDYGNYFIFRATSPMKYTVLLDTYTVDLPEFIEQYQTAETERKVQLNLIKIFSAINAGDYRYAYEKLNPAFRQTNFPTQADFERYAKETFFERNTIGIGNFETFDYVYRYEVTIKNEKQPNAAFAVKKTFSMSLGEGTNFEYSFNV